MEGNLTTKTIVFDLSEVFIGGMHGIERLLAPMVGLREEQVLPLMSGEWLHRLFCGEISADLYYSELLRKTGWNVSAQCIEDLLYENFRTTVPGMDASLPMQLSRKFEVVLLSDHAREWVREVADLHRDLLEVFSTVFFSFNPLVHGTKKELDTFRRVLEILGRQPGECFFIDDSRTNVKTAREAGITSVHFTSAEQLRADLQEHDFKI